MTQLLNSPHLDIVEQAVWCLGNVCNEDITLRDLCIDAGVVQVLSKMLMTPNLSRSSLKNFSWALTNLCRNKPMAPFEKIKDGLPVLLNIFLQHDDDDIIKDVIWSLAYFSDISNDVGHLVASSGILPKLITYLKHK